jgi:hypothetical protein
VSHRHREKTYRIVGYTAPIPGAKYTPEAHGGVCIISTCSCGAERRTNSSGAKRREVGPWVEVEESEGVTS